MKAREWKRAVEPLLPPGGEWRTVGRLTYQVPCEWVAIGVFGESSSRGTGVYVYRARVALLVPDDDLVLTYSDRISPSAIYGSDDWGAFREAILTALDDLPDETTALGELAQVGLQPTIHRLQVAAFASAILGRRENTLDLLGRIVAWTPEYEWGQEIVNRALDFRSVYQDDEAAGIAMLSRWADGTAEARGIERSRSTQ